jgi:hypothetical protein
MFGPSFASTAAVSFVAVLSAMISGVHLDLVAVAVQTPIIYLDINVFTEQFAYV